MRILTYIPVWQRRSITELCYKSLKRSILSAPKELSFVVLIVASDEQDADLARKYGFDVLMCENLPLGRKFNTGLEHALSTWNWDYLFQLNSDDLLSTDFWPIFTDFFTRKLYFFGVNKVYFYDSETKDMREFHYGAGCGIRFIRRDIVEKAGFVTKNNAEVFELWTDYLNGGLDNDSSNTILSRAGKMQHFAMSSPRPVVVDVKSAVNIHSFQEFRNAQRLSESHRKQVMRRFPELRELDEGISKIKAKHDHTA